MSVTIHDIARHTGFNASTVSRALRYDSRISRKTVEKIWETAERLGYVRNFAASNLAAGKSRCVALIMDAEFGSMQTLPAAALNQVLINAGYTLMILLHNNERRATENCIAKLEERICDAAVMIPPPESVFDDRMIERLQRLPIPLCFIDRWLESVRGSVVTTDAESSIRLLVENVLKENIDAAYIVPAADNPVAKARFYWETALLEEAGIPWISEVGELQEMVIQRNVETLAVFADSPWFTTHIREYMKEKTPRRYIGGMFDHWVNVPPDFYDRIYLCLQDFPAIGSSCAELILDILNGKVHEKKMTLIPPEGISVVNCLR